MSAELAIDEAIEFGRAWVESGWTWAPGQVGFGRPGKTPTLAVVMSVDDGKPIQWCTIARPGRKTTLRDGEWVPDHRDDGFLGHALAQVREAWGDDFSIVVGLDGMVEVAHIDTANIIFHRMEPLPKALLAARRAAP